MGNKENKLYILTINNVLGIEEWSYLGVTSMHWEDSGRVVFLTDTGSVSIPNNRVFKLEEIKHKTGSDTTREVT